MSFSPGARLRLSAILLVLSGLCSCQWPVEARYPPPRSMKDDGPVDIRWVWEEKRRAFEEGRLEELTPDEVWSLERSLQRCR